MFKDIIKHLFEKINIKTNFCSEKICSVRIPVTKENSTAYYKIKNFFKKMYKLAYFTTSFNLF